MDNASGNVPNFQPNKGESDESGFSGENSEAGDPIDRGFGELMDKGGPLEAGNVAPIALGQPEQPSVASDSPIVGMMETLLPQQAEPTQQQILGVATTSAQTLDNNVILAAPTPVDLDPPPVSDVPPLSAVTNAAAAPVEAETIDPMKDTVLVRRMPSSVENEAFAGENGLDPGTSEVVGVEEMGSENENESIADLNELLPVPDPAPELADSNTEHEELPLADEEVPNLENESGDSNHSEALLPDVSETEEVAEEIDSDGGVEGLPALLLTPEPPPEPPADEAPANEETSEPVEPSVESVEPVAEEEEASGIESETETQTNLNPAPADRTEGYVKNEFFVSEGAEDPWILPAAATAGVAANAKRKKRIRSSSGKVDYWGIITSVFFFCGIILIGAIGVAWLMRGTIAERIETKIARKVADAGYFIDYGERSFDPVRGLVLNDVTLFETDQKVVPYAKINNVGFNTDVLALLKSKDIENANKTLSFQDSNLSFFEQGELLTEFKQLKGFLKLAPGEIGLESLKGQLEGLVFDVEGSVLLTEPNSEEVTFGPSQSESSSVATSDSENKAKNILDALAAEADSEPVEVPSRPTFAPREDIVIPRPVPEREPEPAQTEPQIVVQDAPVVAPEIADPPTLENIPAASNDSVAPDSISIPPPDLASSVPSTPEVTIDLPPGAVASNLPSLAMLKKLISFARIDSASEKPPVLSGDLDLDLRDPEARKVKVSGRLAGATITMQDSILQGITFNSVDVPFSYDHESGMLVLSDFKFGYGDEGEVTGNASYDSKGKNLALKAVRSSIDLVGLLSEFNPQVKDSFKSIQFIDAPTIMVNRGNFPIPSFLEGSAEFSYSQWSGMVVNTAGKSLPVREVRGDFKLDSGMLSTSNLYAKVLDGPTTASGSMDLKDASLPFRGTIGVSSLPMESIARYAGIEGGYLKGLLNLKYQGVLSKEISDMTGSGAVELQNGQLYKVPVVGAVQRLLGAAIPVFGPDGTSSAYGNYIVKKGILGTSDLLVRSDGTKIAVRGQADLKRQLTVFRAHAALDGPLGVATGLADQAIEIEGQGKLHSPQIRLRNGGLPAGFSNDAVRNILGIAEGSTNAMRAMMQEIESGGVGSLINGLGGSQSRAVPTREAVTEEVINRAAGAIQGIVGGNQ